MKQRRYSVAEVDRMRAALCSVNPYHWPQSWFGNTAEENRDRHYKSLEDQLRTYLMAGVSPNDLEEQVNETLRQKAEYQLKLERLRQEYALEQEYGPRP